MVWDFSLPPLFSSARWLFEAPGAFSVRLDFISEPLDSVALPPPPADGEPWCIAAPPPEAPSFFMPCAFTAPAPAISAIAATEIRKRLLISFSSQCLALPARTTAGDIRCSTQNPVPPGLFLERAMNALATTKRPAKKPALRNLDEAKVVSR